jgi:hypothetical protein
VAGERVGRFAPSSLPPGGVKGLASPTTDSVNATAPSSPALGGSQAVSPVALAQALQTASAGSLTYSDGIDSVTLAALTHRPPAVWSPIEAAFASDGLAGVS